MVSNRWLTEKECRYFLTHVSSKTTAVQESYIISFDFRKTEWCIFHGVEVYVITIAFTTCTLSQPATHTNEWRD